MVDQTKRAFTVHWVVKEGEVDAALDIIARFAPLARTEPGLEVLTVQQSAEDPRKFMFYEIFADEAAFAVHQETAHFKQMIMEEALPKLSFRERTAYRLA
jgi:quinol monooxygenase YgiN